MSERDDDEHEGEGRASGTDQGTSRDRPGGPRVTLTGAESSSVQVSRGGVSRTSASTKEALVASYFLYTGERSTLWIHQRDGVSWP